MVEFCEAFTDFEGDYGLVSKAIARRIFKDSSEADRKIEIERLKEWAASIDDKEMKKVVLSDIKELSKRKPGNKKAEWYATGAVGDEDDNSSDFKFTGVWKRYRDYLAECPRYPLRGPPEWDLTEWSDEEKKPFSFAHMDNSD